MNIDYLRFKNRKEIKDYISNDLKKQTDKRLLKLFLNFSGEGNSLPSIYPLESVGASYWLHSRTTALHLAQNPSSACISFTFAQALPKHGLSPNSSGLDPLSFF